MGVYLVCKKRKNHPQMHKDVCISLKCSHLIAGYGKGYECNYKTKSELRLLRKVKSDPFLVAD